jgi:hypothetical protein
MADGTDCDASLNVASVPAPQLSTALQTRRHDLSSSSTATAWRALVAALT